MARANREGDIPQGASYPKQVGPSHKLLGPEYFVLQSTPALTVFLSEAIPSPKRANSTMKSTSYYAKSGIGNVGLLNSAVPTTLAPAIRSYSTKTATNFPVRGVIDTLERRVTCRAFGICFRKLLRIALT